MTAQVGIAEEHGLEAARGTKARLPRQGVGTIAPKIAPRIAVVLWFLGLAVIYAKGILRTWATIPQGSVRFADWSPIVSGCAALIFFCALGRLSWVRPNPSALRPGLTPKVVSLLGTYAVWFIPLLPAAKVSEPVAIAGSAITLLGSVLILVAIAGLGRSFSITPQARTLVVSGPYGIVRHPLYAAEEIAVIGLLTHYVWFAALPFLLLHLALQVRRMLYEEGVLSAAFPEYKAYAKRTARLIPGVW